MPDNESVEKITKNALALAVYDRNIDAWRSPSRGSGSPTLLSKVHNLQGMIGNGQARLPVWPKPFVGPHY